jgi:hypothetical protein
MKENFSMCLLAALALVTGCSKSSGDGKWSPTMENKPPLELSYVGKDTPVPQLKDDDVIVAVGGDALTKGEFYARMKQVEWTIKRTPGFRANDFSDAYQYAGRTLIPRYVRETVIAQTARDEKLATADEIRTNVEATVERFCGMYRIKRDDIDKAFPGGLAAVQRDAERSTWLRIYTKRHSIKGKTITDTVVSNILDQIASENAAIAVSNAAIRAKLEGFRADIVAGKAKFEDVAKKHSEDVNQEEGGFWGVFRRDTLSDSDLIFVLDEGAVSEVLEDGDSYYIVRVEKKTAAKRDAGRKLIEPETVTLSRIQLFKYEETVLASAGTLKADLQQQMDDEALERHLETLMANAKIVYPHGTNFWAKAEAGKAGTGEKK